MSSNPPTTLGKYQIIREIARSNDIVYEAYDPLMNRRVAIKELAVPGGSTSQQKEDRVKRFLREARAAGSLQHPNIMTVFEVGEEGGRYYIAMEYLDGKTLRNELDTKGFLPPDKAVEIAHGVLEGLSYAHGKGVIHRDIKPDNIQLISNGGVKITDFGIARLTFEPNLTQDGQVFGTPSYMSPEQVVGRDIDARSDLFSVGTVLYEMLAGTKPFAGDSVVAITYAIMNKQPDRPQQVGYAMWQVLERALDKSPQLRFRDASEFIQALDNAARASTSVVIDPNPVLPPQQPLMNPYGAPGGFSTGAPPVVAPPVPYVPYPQGTPYNPAPAPYPPANPYGNPTPYGGYSAPYGQPNPYGPQQPYGQQPYMQQPYGQPTGQPTYSGPIPVYYPPPPRAPLLKPATRRLLLQILGVVAVLAIFFALVIAAINYSAQRLSQPSRTATNAPGSPPGGPGTLPANTQPLGNGAEAQALAKQDSGVKAYKAGDIDQAVRDLREAVRISPTTAAFQADFGRALYAQGAKATTGVRALELKHDAAEAYKVAFNLETDPKTKAEYARAGAEIYWEVAQGYVALKRSREARQVLYDCRPLVRDDPEMSAQVELLLNLLSGRG